MKRYTTYLTENTPFEIRLPEAQTVTMKFKIGEGGFGEVWRAVHPSQPKNYALKQINIPYLIEKGRINRDDKATLIERIKREASIDVPSEFVVKCYGCRDIEENFFLLFDFVFGDSFGDWLRDHRNAPWPVKKALFLDILRGVRDLHRAGIIHRDLKPSNILITYETQKPKIIDFGLAKLDDSSMTMSGDFSGSKFYKDPSLIREWKGIKSGDESSDVYALGLLLYELIVGKNLWDANGLLYEEIFNQIVGKDNALDLDRQFQLDAAPEEVAAVRETIQRSTRFDRTNRLSSVDEMLALLGETPSQLRSTPSTPATSAAPVIERSDGLSLSKGRNDAPVQDVAAPRPKQAPPQARPKPAPTPPVAPSERQPAKRGGFGKMVFIAMLIAAGVLAYQFREQWLPAPVEPIAQATATPEPTATPKPTPTPEPTATPGGERPALPLETASEMLTLDIATNQASYRSGERVVVTIRASQTCYLTLYDISVNGEVAQIFPNGHSDANRLEAGNTYRIPAASDSFDFAISGDPGMERFLAVATKEDIALFKEQRQQSGNDPFPVLSRYEDDFERRLHEQLALLAPEDWTQASVTFQVR